jgi:hypothetical protein
MHSRQKEVRALETLEVSGTENDFYFYFGGGEGVRLGRVGLEALEGRRGDGEGAY